VRKFAFILFLCCIAVLAFFVRCWNLPDIFVAGRIYFIDPDCYSRMTRAARVAAGDAMVHRQHDFENWPDGITAHTTALLDWLIVALKKGLDFGFRVFDSAKTSVLHEQTLDLAGALISPLLGALACAWLAAWAWSAARHSTLVARHLALAAPILFAISPIAVHGTALGRPDHQSLIILLLAVAIGAEVRLMQTVREFEKKAQPPHRHIAKWSLIGGVASGLAMWVSLYEPLILLAVSFLLVLLLDRVQFRWRERWWGWAGTAAIYGISLIIEGWSFSLPPQTARTYFLNWARGIGELAHLDLAGPLLWRWVGWLAAIAPVTLGVVVWMKAHAARRAGDGAHPAYRPAAFLFGLLLVTFGLTCWQLRWGYFFALVFAMSVPWQLAALRRWWIAWPAFVVAIYPIAQEWDTRLFPDETTGQTQRMQRLERLALRDLVERKGETVRGGFIAPWWLSPSIAYWTRDRGVAGSSHESLPGTVETARFYLANDGEGAAAILRARNVAWVLADEPSRVIENSAELLGVEVPEQAMAGTLFEDPQHAPAFLHELALGDESRGGATFYRIYAVEPEKFP
jgi:hypothetical protein